MSNEAIRIDRGSLHVYTFKAGLLARAAHDLRLSVSRFEIVATGNRLSAWFDPDSMIVDGVASNGEVDSAAPAELDKRTIGRTVRDEILSTRQYPRIEYEGTFVQSVTSVQVTGVLSLRGRRAPVSIELAPEQGDLVAHVSLVPSRWGIRPYRALFGAIHLQDRVDVVLRVADPRA